MPKRYAKYLGPKVDLGRESLQEFEGRGYICQSKIDGCWCAMVCSPEGNTFTSRNNKPFSGESINGLEFLDTGLQDTELVGEIECATEAATAIYRKLGYRRIRLYDINRLNGADLTSLSYGKRWEILQQVHAELSEAVQERLLLVEAWLEGFQVAYDWACTQEGIEGVVLKKLHHDGHSEKNSSGKSDTQLRCKRTVTGDFVVMGWDLTEISKGLTAKLGLYKKGQLVKVMTAAVPDMELTEDKRLNHEGRVAEFMGWDRFKSGALRHGQFVRWREDKNPEDCTN
jgi:ATP-dependent DNA ligase